MSIECRKCGAGLDQCSLLVRVNETGVKGIWECSPRCGIPFVSNIAALTYALSLNEKEEEDGSTKG